MKILSYSFFSEDRIQNFILFQLNKRLFSVSFFEIDEFKKQNFCHFFFNKMKFSTVPTVNFLRVVENNYGKTYIFRGGHKERPSLKI